jgi:GAF domain-containing protein
LVEAVRRAIEAAESERDVLRSAVEVIDGFSDGFSWTGFYMMRGDHLEVGPYLGPKTPHERIELNAGICGAAASRRESILVDDVNADPRFLACSLTTKSEIVVPLLDGETCLGEVDIDSDRPAFFTAADREMLEEIAALIAARLKALAP